MSSEAYCPTCGRVIPFGEKACPYCSRRKSLGLRQDTAILILFGALLVLVPFVGVLVRAYNHQEQALAKDWAERGKEDLRNGKAEEALVDFRTSMVYAHDDSAVRLQYAQALIASHRLDEAWTYLRTLWVDEPGDARLNLQLARLAARLGRDSEAVDYYHNAILGAWQENPAQSRISTRIELIEFLLGHGRNNDAVTQLNDLINVMPDSVSNHILAANLLMRAGATDRALTEYRDVLRLDRNQQKALADAGTILYQKEQYSDAVGYLERAIKLNPADAFAKELLATSQQVLSLDPFDPHLSTLERGRRVGKVFQLALGRLEDCATTHQIQLDLPADEPPPTNVTPEQQLYASAEKIKPSLRNLKSAGDPDNTTRIMDLVSAIEARTARICGNPVDANYAIQLICRKHNGANP
jgi:tetratricopeptide (TPR) repeat protein